MRALGQYYKHIYFGQIKLEIAFPDHCFFVVVVVSNIVSFHLVAFNIMARILVPLRHGEHWVKAIYGGMYTYSYASGSVFTKCPYDIKLLVGHYFGESLCWTFR